MDETLADLLALLDLERIEVNLFRGLSPQTGWQRVFGGQVLGQALVAALRTVEGRGVHSFHGYFLRPGDPKVPILYDVDRIRDGRSFTTRRVVAIQHGRAIFNMAASFQVAEGGFDHQESMPEVPGPDGLPNETELRARYAHKIPEELRQVFTRDRPIEIRPVDPVDEFDPEKAPAHQSIWFRTAAAMPDDPAIHQCVLAYASDMNLLDTCLRPHAVLWTNPKFQSASLDHAMWFHRPFRTDQWLLYRTDSPSASGARGFNRGSIFTQEGELVASCTQEGLIRMHDD
ncbi:MAG: acyl-CoA thioesterase II [Deltaproteobacteria bacterium]|nr:acyl-CoA thioesterase II [Deltaproteobacteria bacterium]